MDPYSNLIKSLSNVLNNHDLINNISNEYTFKDLLLQHYQFKSTIKNAKYKYLSHIIYMHDLNEINILKNLYYIDNKIKECLMYLLDCCEKWKIVGIFDFVKSNIYYSNIIPENFSYQYLNTIYIFDIEQIIEGCKLEIHNFNLFYFNKYFSISSSPNKQLILVEHVIGFCPIVRLVENYSTNDLIICKNCTYNPFIIGNYFKINNKVYIYKSCKINTIYKYNQSPDLKYTIYFGTSGNLCTFFICKNDTRVGYNYNNNSSSSSSNIITINKIEYSYDKGNTYNIFNLEFDLKFYNNTNPHIFNNINNVIYTGLTSINSLMDKKQISKKLIFDNIKFSNEDIIYKLSDELKIKYKFNDDKTIVTNVLIYNQDDIEIITSIPYTNKFKLINENYNINTDDIIYYKYDLDSFVLHLKRIYNINKNINIIKTKNFLTDLLFTINYNFFKDNNFFECETSNNSINETFIDILIYKPIWDYDSFIKHKC